MDKNSVFDKLFEKFLRSPQLHSQKNRAFVNRIPKYSLFIYILKEIRTQLEIDFIATLGSKKYYIQSAYAIPDQAKYEQETASFDKTMDSFKKIVVVEKSMKPRRDEKGYVMMGVKEFLLDKDSLEA